jgi:two-component system, response regulator PdtaR
LLRVLIVEDEPLIAIDLQDILEDAGHTVVGIAPAMQQAIDLAAGAMPFDVAILDIDLAGCDDGIETAHRLRAEHGIDALFVSARIEEEARARELGWRPIGFIAKPFMETQILAALSRVEARR